MVLFAFWMAALTGTWTGARLNADGREEPLTLRLRQEGAGLLGSVRISVGEVPIREGRAEGDSFRFVTEIPFLPAPQRTEYRGTVKGDRIELEILRDGGQVRRSGWARRISPNPEPWLRQWPAGVAPKEALAPTGLAPAPPMGWNSWNRFGAKIDDATVRAMADALVSTGLKDAGYVFVNIDDGWQGERAADGTLRPNSNFPDMKALADYVHSKGLKLGIYSSPGPKTCAGFAGSYGHEEQDARTFAGWGVDYLKYDWCSAGLAWDIGEMGEAYRKMALALRATGRPVIYSICQYGLLRVWEWAPAAGGNLWRTTGDIGNSWASLREIGFSQTGLEKYAGPGRWNDPDMLEIGNGALTLQEERTHFTLWAMLAAPLLLGHDLRQTKPETLAILKNAEVIAINQDTLGKQGYRAVERGAEQIWLKPLSGGAWAVALFNLGEQPVSPSVLWTQLGIAGTPRVRDLWKGEDWGKVQGGFSHRIEPHSCALFKVTP
jgi:alpha-galactosidase